jgi:hypothetical protein
MKKLHKLAAAVAVAAGIALSPQANAIQMKPNGAGDALLFPIYYGQFENLFTITNNSGNWIQGHLRFRGATWSTELRDFDVILSPGDVFVFRLADLDGDGQWEIDQSLDTRNFQYTGMVFTCQGPNGEVPNCLDPSPMLEPTVFTAVTTKARLDAQRNAGHIEFIGEAVLHGMTHAIMNALIGSNPGAWQPYVTSNGNGRGTNSWKWSAAQDGFPLCPKGVSGGYNSAFCDHGLRDVPNVLTGTAFITYPGQVSGLAYNADALVDFRTNSAAGTHRVENYGHNVPVVANTGDGAVVVGSDNSVIVHVEDASASAAFDYLYGCPGSGENRRDEVVTSFNNTWGPSLADGDSLVAAGGVVPSNLGPVNWGTGDVWDQRFRLTTLAEERVGTPAAVAGGTNQARYGYPLQPTHVDSIWEVEQAIAAAGQVFYGYYFHNGGYDRSAGTNQLKSWYMGYAPTKFFYAEDIDVSAVTGSCIDHVNNRVNYLSTVGKPVGIEVWNHEEVPCSGKGTISPSNANPAILGEELSIWNIDWMKGLSAGDKNCANFQHGRVVVNTTGANPAYPFLLYTFELDNGGRMYNMRAMQR